jgi:hypothetical protein
VSTLCPIAHYNPITEQAVCAPCPDKSSTDKVGATTVKDCVSTSVDAVASTELRDRLIATLVSTFGSIFLAILTFMFQRLYLNRSWKAYPVHDFIRTVLELDLDTPENSAAFIGEVAQIITSLKAHGLDLRYLQSRSDDPEVVILQHQLAQHIVDAMSHLGISFRRRGRVFFGLLPSLPV